jgi:hypothetical protein
MSPELIGILSGGATLAGLMLWMGGRLRDVDQRLARIEGRFDSLEGLVSRLVPQANSGD